MLYAEGSEFAEFREFLCGIDYLPCHWGLATSRSWKMYFRKITFSFVIKP